ncbi:MAG: hypothetical protein HXY24_19165 [Rubrivivax sp.]|nr:hypothetical protein [Rubrivivax sp.]
MFRKLVLVTLVVMLAIPLVTPTAAQEDKPKIGFLPGIVDPFYQVMELGVNQAVKDFGLGEVVT